VVHHQRLFSTLEFLMGQLAQLERLAQLAQLDQLAQLALSDPLALLGQQG